MYEDGDESDSTNANSGAGIVESGYQGWLDIPGFDGGPPFPYPGYLHSFDFAIQEQRLECEVVECLLPGVVFLGPCIYSTFADVNISLYVVLNSKGALYSMTAWAYDNDGDGYEVPVYYSAVGKRLRC